MRAAPSYEAFRITVPAALEDDATVLLSELDTAGLEMQAAASGESCFLAYFLAAPGLGPRVVQSLSALPGARVEPSAIPDVDWVARFREGFRPFHAAGFAIVPEWCAGEDAYAPRAGGLRIIVDPGQAFGTGTHETTRLCLQALRDVAAKHRLGSVLDVGTGSGILAVGAALLGATRVVGIENDPDALGPARDHGRLNGITLHLLRGDGAAAVHPGVFDVVIANITAPLLVAKHAEIQAACRRGGTVILSGLLQDELDAVRDAFAAPSDARTLRDGEWAALVLRTPS